MPSYGREMAGKFLHFFLLLFDSIGGAVELARSRNKVHTKIRKISFSRNFCSAIYTYSTVCNNDSLGIFAIKNHCIAKLL